MRKFADFFLPNIFFYVKSLFYLIGARRKAMDEDHSSLMTYRGHQIVHTLIRCRFSPAHTTGQRYIYTGCASGAVVSKYKIIFYFKQLPIQIIHFQHCSRKNIYEFCL